MGDEYQADVVIVGGGVAGLLPAWRLAQAGVDVLVLEAGPRVVRPEALQNYRSAVAKTPESPYPSVPYAPHPDVTSLEDGYYVQEGPALFKSTYTRRLGGSTWHWLGTSMRHLPNDFRIRTLYGVGEDWPISYDDLEPWYYEAEKELGVAGDSSEDLGSPRRNDYPLPPIPPTYLDRVMAVAARDVGVEIKATPQARNSIYYDNRPPCCGNATCVPICPVQAKYDATAHAKKVEEIGGRILDQAVVFMVEVDSEGLVSGVRFKRPDGSEHRAAGRIFVVAAHAIETPKLLLISRTDALPNGVANSSGAAGRYLMDHPLQLSWALAQEPIYPYRAPLETAGIEQFRDGDFRRERAAFRSPIGNDGWRFPGENPIALAPDLIGQGLRGQALIDELNRQVVRQFRFAGLIEQLPLFENRIEPAFDRVDALGIPRPRIYYRYDEYVQRGLAEARRVHDLVFRAMNATDVHHSDDPYGAGHIIGTYRMGTDPAQSVVDAELRSHDHPNLFLLGSGVFPTAGTANPTLTIAALSLRAAETIGRSLAG